jgi:hypothetical protein
LSFVDDAADLLRHARPRELLRALWPSRPKVLNAHAGGTTVSAVASKLAALRPRLLAEAFTPDGKVDYARLRGSALHRELTAATDELGGARFDLDDAAARTAFWINLYNLLAIHGVIALGVRASAMELPWFFGRVAYRVAGHTFTLDEIENGVLRRNARHPVTKRRLFAADDPRLALAPPSVDPRVHGALVCVAASCPPIAFYEPARLDAQLELAARNLVGATAIDDAARVLRVHLVFVWYPDDFGGTAAVRAFLRAHAEPAIARALDDGYAVKPARYDWRLNAPAP